jgi:Tol biopolymer transport system component
VFAVDGALRNGTAAIDDTGVELRRAGQHPVPVVTAARLLAGLGRPDVGPNQLTVAVDPAGDRIAVTVDGVGIVVLDRKGHILGRFTGGSGRIVGDPAWSPDGRSLVFGTGSGDAYTVQIWRIGHPARPRYRTVLTEPAGNTVGGVCLWAADSSGVLCETSTGVVNRWVIANPSAGPVRLVASDLRPVAWLR